MTLILIMLTLIIITIFVYCIHYYNLYRNYSKITSFLREIIEEEGREKSTVNISSTIEKIHTATSEYKPKKTFFGSKGKNDDYFKTAWKQFYQHYVSRDKPYPPDPLYYINEKELFQKAGWRKTIEILPSIFISLGVLITFVSISYSLQAIDIESSTTSGLMDSIKGLLAGMKQAFYSSVVGIIASIVFQFLDRSFLRQSITRQTDEIFHLIDYLIPIPEENEIMQAFLHKEFLPELSTSLRHILYENISKPLQENNNNIIDFTERVVQDQRKFLDNISKNQDHSLGEIVKKQEIFLKNLSEESSENHKKVISLTNTIADRHKTALVDLMDNQRANLEDMFIKHEASIEKVTEKQMKSIEGMASAFEQQIGKGIGNEILKLKNALDHIIDWQTKTQDYIEVLMNKFSEASKIHQTNIQHSEKLNSDLLEYTSQLANYEKHLAKSSDWLHDLIENNSQLLNRFIEERQLFEKSRSEESDEYQKRLAAIQLAGSQIERLLEKYQTELGSLNRQLLSSSQQFKGGIVSSFKEIDDVLAESIRHLANGVYEIENLVQEDLGQVGNHIRQFNDYLQKAIETYNQKVDAN